MNLGGDGEGRGYILVGRSQVRVMVSKVRPRAGLGVDCRKSRVGRG